MNIWYETGQKMIEGNFKDEKEEGIFTRWYENGKKESKGMYRNGEQEGEWTYYNKEGRIKEVKDYLRVINED
jgi:antitoxin component YwqK of YwqJK toxin-antitoxin module